MFESWGRISTTIGSTKIQKASDKNHAVGVFMSIYADKTANTFGTVFEKRPGKFYHLDIEESATEIRRQLVKSQLDDRVLNIMQLMFDEKIMVDTLIAFNIDLEIMPLGKISKIEIDAAFDVLTRLKILCSADGIQHEPKTKFKICELSNQFYSFVPHAFDVRRPTKIETPALVNEKWNMLHNLKELHFAYGLINGATNVLENPFDECFRKLNTIVEPLGKDSDDYKMICEYARNSHAPYHSDYTLEVLDAFCVDRNGEKERFRKYAELGNRMLLWHGSRLTNFAGIFTNGLRIAPPEAISSGYYFGKGIYFANMISKSANYCRHQLKNNVGLMLLCEAPLGKMKRFGASVHPNLGSSFNSVIGFGQTYLDPSKTICFQNKFNVPLGTPVYDASIQSKLRHDEYVVYDEAQVNIKYLVQVKFHWNR